MSPVSSLTTASTAPSSTWRPTSAVSSVSVPVDGRGDHVLHLHRLEPEQRLPGLDPVAQRELSRSGRRCRASAPAASRARSARAGAGKRGSAVRRWTRTAESTNTRSAYGGDVERPPHAGDLEHDPVRGGGHQRASVEARRRSGRPRPSAVADLVLRAVRLAAEALDLRLRRHVAPAAERTAPVPARPPRPRQRRAAPRPRGPRPAPRAVPAPRRPAAATSSGQVRPGSRCPAARRRTPGARRARTSRSRLVTGPCSRARPARAASRRTASARVGAQATTLASIGS